MPPYYTPDRVPCEGEQRAARVVAQFPGPSPNPGQEPRRMTPPLPGLG